MSMIRAVFENGVFRPEEPVGLPEHARVEFEPRLVDDARKAPTLDDIYELLSYRCDTGRRDLAERHNERPPGPQVL